MKNRKLVLKCNEKQKIRMSMSMRSFYVMGRCREVVLWKGNDWEYVMGRCQEVVKWRGSDWEYVMGRCQEVV